MKIFSSENHTLSTVCKHLLRNNVLQHLTRFSRSESYSRCAFLHLKTWSCRSLVAIRRTELRDIPVNFSISLGLLLDPGGLPDCISVQLHARYSVPFWRSLAVRYRPSERSSSLCQSCTEDLSQNWLRTSCYKTLYKCVLHPIRHPFSWRMTLIDNLSSFMKGMFINKLWRNNDVKLCFL